MPFSSCTNTLLLCPRSYLLPVINHYLLYFGLARCQRADGLYRVPTHPYWHRNGSDEANAMWVPGRDGVQPLETEVRVRLNKV
jgi:hypothetical protein